MTGQLSFRRLFIANRGEVAARVARTCHKLGITPVFAVSEADLKAPYLRDAEFICVGAGRSSESYLDATKLVQAARQTACTALHPGWGFLSENARFAQLCEQHGISFIGPPPHVTQLMGTKTPAKRRMAAAGLSVIPGSEGVVDSETDCIAVAKEIGLPVLIKAESGGGGRGMRIARSDDEITQAYQDARQEAEACFGDSRVYVEKLIEGGRHVEIQLLADRYGNAIHLGERDCTVQRNHQKLIEESPCPVLADDERQRTLTAAVHATQDIGYVGAGTMEFLLDESVSGKPTLRFMEMNTRLQVEHCVSEMRSGIDLVAEQILIAAGHKLRYQQKDVVLEGHAIECRLNAEDPRDNFRPNPGTITKWERGDNTDGIRIDTHIESGYTIPPHYDSLIAKAIAHAPTREQAAAKLEQTLGRLTCDGVKTTIPMHRAILASEDFLANRYDTRTVPGWSQTEPR